MKLELIRDTYTTKSTIGQLLINGKFQCYLLEDEDKLGKGLPKVHGTTAIPEGTYKLIISRSARFSKLAGKDVYLPEIIGIKDYSGVRIHSGNKPEDSEGCPLTGKTKGIDFVGDSRTAMTELMAVLVTWIPDMNNVMLPVLKEESTITVTSKNKLKII